MRSRSESWCPEGLREALASESDDLDRQKLVLKLTGSIESTRGGGGRRKAGGGGRSEEEGGRREEGGAWREEGGERRKEEGRFQTAQSAHLPFQPFAFGSVGNHVASDG